ncbi:MAG: hypothetical protein ACJ74O_11040 [Frankiaceae bacterium]
MSGKRLVAAVAVAAGLAAGLGAAAVVLADGGQVLGSGNRDGGGLIGSGT